MSHPPASDKIAYLTGEYPAISHTFILREVLALRARGREVVTCAVRQTDAAHHIGPDEKDAAATTFYILKEAKNPAVLLASIGAALAAPGRVMAALKLAWQTRSPGAKALLYQLIYLIEAMVLARHLKAQGVTHLHNHFGNSSCSVAMLASAVSGIPFSYTMHGSAIFFEPHRWRIDAKMAQAKFVACISHFCRAQGMVFAAQEHWHKLRVVHCGVRPGHYSAEGRKDGAKQLIFVGRLAGMKGVPVLLDALAELLPRHPDAHLTLVGDGAERPAIEAQVAQLGLDSAVTFAGYRNQDEVAGDLARANVFVLPSFIEGLPVVLMEAMASGLPVISSVVAGVPELVEDGKTGYLTTPGDKNSLVTALDKMLSDPARAQKMGAAAKAKVAAEFDIDREAAWLDTILSGNAPDGALRPPG